MATHQEVFAQVNALRAQYLPTEDVPIPGEGPGISRTLHQRFATKRPATAPSAVPSFDLNEAPSITARILEGRDEGLIWVSVGPPRDIPIPTDEAEALRVRQKEQGRRFWHNRAITDQISKLYQTLPA